MAVVLFISSLFNIDYDIDIYTKIYDNTRKSSSLKLPCCYNTYSKQSIEEWIGDQYDSYELLELSIGIDLENSSRGLGTYTVRTNSNEWLQMSGGYLMSWDFL